MRQSVPPARRAAASAEAQRESAQPSRSTANAQRTGAQRPRGAIIAGAALAVVVAAVVLVLAFGHPNAPSKSADGLPGPAPTVTPAATTATPSAGPPPSPTTHRLADQPGYEPATYLTELFAKHLAAYEDDSLYQHVPTSTGGHDYVWDFLYLLAEQRDGLRQAGGTTSTDTAERRLLLPPGAARSGAPPDRRHLLRWEPIDRR